MVSRPSTPRVTSVGAPGVATAHTPTATFCPFPICQRIQSRVEEAEIFHVASLDRDRGGLAKSRIPGRSAIGIESGALALATPPTSSAGRQTRGILWALAAAIAALIACSTAGVAQGRPATAARDGRPNILVVMTDDMAAKDVAQMPNVRRLLAARGTTFADAVDSFPLCCPARATFITGQYAHNHGVRGNFYPYGWYGMKDRGTSCRPGCSSRGTRPR